MASYDLIPTLCPHYFDGPLIAGRTYVCRGCACTLQISVNGGPIPAATYPGKKDSAHTTAVSKR